MAPKKSTTSGQKMLAKKSKSTKSVIDDSENPSSEGEREIEKTAKPSKISKAGGQSSKTNDTGDFDTPGKTSQTSKAPGAHETLGETEATKGRGLDPVSSDEAKDDTSRYAGKYGGAASKKRFNRTDRQTKLLDHHLFEKTGKGQARSVTHRPLSKKVSEPIEESDDPIDDDMDDPEAPFKHMQDVKAAREAMSKAHRQEKSKPNSSKSLPEFRSENQHIFTMHFELKRNVNESVEALKDRVARLENAVKIARQSKHGDKDAKKSKGENRPDGSGHNNQDGSRKLMDDYFKPMTDRGDKSEQAAGGKRGRLTKGGSAEKGSGRAFATSPSDSLSSEPRKKVRAITDVATGLPRRSEPSGKSGLSDNRRQSEGKESDEATDDDELY